MLGIELCCGDPEARRGGGRKSDSKQQSAPDDDAEAFEALASHREPGTATSRASCDRSVVETSGVEYAQQSLLNKKLQERDEQIQARIDKSERDVRRLHEELSELNAEAESAKSQAEAQSGQAETEVEEEKEATLFRPEATIEASTEAGVRSFAAGEHSLARLHFFQARQYACDQGDEKAEARAEGNISNVYSAVGNPKQALVHFKRAVYLLRKLRETALECFILTNGVICCIQLQRYDEALGLSLRKLALAMDDQDKTEAEEWIDRINEIISSGSSPDLSLLQAEGKSSAPRRTRSDVHFRASAKADADTIAI